MKSGTEWEIWWQCVNACSVSGFCEVEAPFGGGAETELVFIFGVGCDNPRGSPWGYKGTARDGVEGAHPIACQDAQVVRAGICRHQVEGAIAVEVRLLYMDLSVAMAVLFGVIEQSPCRKHAERPT
jgi:hypothetical protein